MPMSEVPTTFTIRHSFLLPLGLLLLLTVALTVVSAVKGFGTGHLAVLCALLIPATIIFVESLSRRVLLYDDRIRIKKLFRSKELFYKDVLAVDTMQVRKRVFLSLSTEKNFIILSNAYAGFPELVNSLLGHFPAQVISDETRQMAQAPPVKSSDIISCWLAVLLVALIVYLQVAR